MSEPQRQLHAVGDALDRELLEAVAVAGLVLVVEGDDHLIDRGAVELAARHLDERRVPGLADQPPVERAPHLHVGDARRQLLTHVRLHLLEDRSTSAAVSGVSTM